ncbi:hypothetical protein TKK_0003967 [Trichogramma kaykai]
MNRTHIVRRTVTFDDYCEAVKMSKTKKKYVLLDDNDNVVINVQKVQTEVPSAYPSAWFEAHPNLKPTVHIYYDPAHSSDLENWLLTGIALGSVDVKLINAYIHYRFKSTPVIATEDWSSYNLELAKKEAPVTPWDLVKIEMSKPNISPKEGKATFQPGDWLLGFCLSATRLMGATVAEYRDELKKRLFAILQAHGFSGAIYPPEAIYSNWVGDPNYRKICAAVDMYLRK